MRGLWPRLSKYTSGPNKVEGLRERKNISTASPFKSATHGTGHVADHNFAWVHVDIASQHVSKSLDLYLRVNIASLRAVPTRRKRFRPLPRC